LITPLQINIAGHFGTLLLWALGLTFLFALAGGALHAVGHRLRWFHLHKDGPRWFLILAALLALSLCLLAGAWTGVKVGTVRAVARAADEAGPQLLLTGVEATLKAAGLTNASSLDVARAREWLDQFEKAPLPPMEFPQGETLRRRIEEIRPQVSTRLRGLLDQHAPGGRITVDDLVSRTWRQIHEEMWQWVRGFTRVEILEGLAVVALAETLAVLLCWVVRKLAPEPEAGPTR